MSANRVIGARVDISHEGGLSAVYSSPRYEAARAYVVSGQIWLIAIMLFLLTGANGRPGWWNSALPATLMSLWLIGSRGPTQVIRHAMSRNNAWIFWSMVLLTIWTGLSAVATKDSGIGLNFVLRCVVPLLIYLAVV